MSSSVEDIKSKNNMKIVEEKTPTVSGLQNSDLENIHHHIGRNKAITLQHRTSFNSQGVLPQLQINSMRTRVKNQTNIFEDNLRLYEKLKNTKPRIPTKN